MDKPISHKKTAKFGKLLPPIVKQKEGLPPMVLSHSILSKSKEMAKKKKKKKKKEKIQTNEQKKWKENGLTFKKFQKDTNVKLDRDDEMELEAQKIENLML